MLERLPGLIPELRTLVVSTEVFASAPETEVVLYTVFDSPEDLQAYQVHPEHKKCVAFVSAVVAERRVVDYFF
jgi:heme-degrading monooxygenase HmoA